MLHFDESLYFFIYWCSQAAEQAERFFLALRLKSFKNQFKYFSIHRYCFRQRNYLFEELQVIVLC